MKRRTLPTLIVVWVVTLFTLGSGLIGIYSVLGPITAERVTSLRQVFPLELLDISRFVNLLTGFALVLSSLNIYWRKRRAYYAVVGLASLSAIFHLMRSVNHWSKGEHYEEALLSLALVLLLAWSRKEFTVRSETLHTRATIQHLAFAVILTVAYAAVGFWLLEPREFGVNFDWRESLRQALLVLSFVGHAGLTPHTRYAHWFLQSLAWIETAALVYCGYLLFRPVYYRFQRYPREMAWARQILAAHGRSGLDFFKAYPDKSYFFSLSRRSFLAYRVGAGCAVVLGDPVGPAEELEPLLRDFLALCRDNDWRVGFHQVLPDYLEIYHNLGLKRLKVGDEAVVDLSRFCLAGKHGKGFQSKINQLERAGIVTLHQEPPIPDETIEQIRVVSDDWLRIPGRRERQFTLGRFDPEYLRTTPLFMAVDRTGKILAFVNIIQSYHPQEATIDLMRRRTDAPNGIMDYLFVKLFLRMKERGFTRFSLGLAPLAGSHDAAPVSTEEQAVHALIRHLRLLFSFEGILSYKAKFATIWEPRYLIYQGAVDLPRLGIALNQVSELPKRERLTRKRRFLTLVLLVAAVCAPVWAQERQPGRQTMAIRGQSQDVYYYPAGRVAAHSSQPILFMPGDGGWRGFAIEMARAMSAVGYDVYGWDTKRYLMSFTGKTTLREPEIMADVASMAVWIQQSSSGRVTLVGWSEGAGLALLAAASPTDKKLFTGLVAIGLPDSAILGWRRVDDLTYLTKREPNEPTFATAPYLSQVSPLALALIYSTRDEYISPAESNRLFSAAQEPKRFSLVAAQNHRYDGNRGDFFRALKEALEWVDKNSR
jgi:phosphatidylglycerol lysyltransferase